MRAITNQTGSPHWDAHGRLIPPGGIIAFESGVTPATEAVKPEVPPTEDAPIKGTTTPQPDAKSGKGTSK